MSAGLRLASPSLIPGLSQEEEWFVMGGRRREPGRSGDEVGSHWVCKESSGLL